MKVEVAVAEAANCKRDLTIEVPAEEVKAEFEKSYQSFARFAKVPGFRPGHVPLAVVKQRFKRDVSEGVLEHLLPHALQHAIVDNKLKVIGEPDISEVSLTEGEPLRFKATVEVLPEFELKEHGGLKLTKTVIQVDDQSVDRVIAEMREAAAQLVPVEDRASEAGDTVSVNLVGKYVEPEGEEDLTADDVSIELGAEGVQAEFNDNLTGVRAGDIREFRVVYPAEFTSPGLAGKTVDFTATIVAVRRKELPEADDEFAKGVDGSETLEALRNSVRQRLEEASAARAESDLRSSAVEEVIKQYDFEVPQSIVDRQAEDLIRSLAYEMIRGGLPPNMLREMNWSERRDEAKTRAVKDVRVALVLERIAEAEKIRVEAEEIDAEIEAIAAQRGEAVEAVKARLTKDDAVSNIENRLRRQKTLDVIIKSADVTVKEITEAQAAESDAPSAPQPDASTEDA